MAERDCPWCGEELVFLREWDAATDLLSCPGGHRVVAVRGGPTVAPEDVPPEDVSVREDVPVSPEPLVPPDEPAPGGAVVPVPDVDGGADG